MFRLERQVLLTYTTWRWMWVIVPAYAAMASGAYLVTTSDVAKVLPWIFVPFGLGIPSMFWLQWLVLVAKWQFANPRARLFPGYAVPHTAVLGVVIAVLLVLHPLCFAAASGIAPLGSLAFALSLGGAFLWACHRNNGPAAAPAMLIFLSGMTGFGHHFWFSQQGGYHMLHGLLTVFGAALVVGWLWRLVHLNEEMSDYQTSSPGGIGLSRLERSEQSRSQGKLAARSVVIAALIDHWHDRPHSNDRAALLRYGFGRVSGGLQAVFFGVSCAIYGVILYQLHFVRTNMTTPDSLWFPITIAVAIPTAGAGLHLAQRKPRMAQELLRPATRTQYVDGLLRALAKQTSLLWLALQLALIVVVVSIDGFLPHENLVPLATAYLLVSLAMQVPAFGFCIGIASWSSLLLQILSIYVVVGLEVLAIWAWWSAREQLGNFSAMAIVIVVSLPLGAALIRTARRSWLRAELG